MGISDILCLWHVSFKIQLTDKPNVFWSLVSRSASWRKQLIEKQRIINWLKVCLNEPKARVTIEINSYKPLESWAFQHLACNSHNPSLSPYLGPSRKYINPQCLFTDFISEIGSRWIKSVLVLKLGTKMECPNHKSTVSSFYLFSANQSHSHDLTSILYYKQYLNGKS